MKYMYKTDKTNGLANLVKGVNPTMKVSEPVAIETFLSKLFPSALNHCNQNVRSVNENTSESSMILYATNEVDGSDTIGNSVDTSAFVFTNAVAMNNTDVQDQMDMKSVTNENIEEYISQTHVNSIHLSANIEWEINFSADKSIVSEDMSETEMVNSSSNDRYKVVQRSEIHNSDVHRNEKIASEYKPAEILDKRNNEIIEDLACKIHMKTNDHCGQDFKNEMEQAGEVDDEQSKLNDIVEKKNSLKNIFPSLNLMKSTLPSTEEITKVIKNFEESCEDQNVVNVNIKIFKMRSNSMEESSCTKPTVKFWSVFAFFTELFNTMCEGNIEESSESITRRHFGKRMKGCHITPLNKFQSESQSLYGTKFTNTLKVLKYCHSILMKKIFSDMLGFNNLHCLIKNTKDETATGNNFETLQALIISNACLINKYFEDEDTELNRDQQAIVHLQEKCHETDQKANTNTSCRKRPHENNMHANSKRPRQDFIDENMFDKIVKDYGLILNNCLDMEMKTGKKHSHSTIKVNCSISVDRNNPHLDNISGQSFEIKKCSFNNPIQSAVLIVSEKLNKDLENDTAEKTHLIDSHENVPLIEPTYKKNPLVKSGRTKTCIKQESTDSFTDITSKFQKSLENIIPANNIFNEAIGNEMDDPRNMHYMNNKNINKHEKNYVGQICCGSYSYRKDIANQCLLTQNMEHHQYPNYTDNKVTLEMLHMENPTGNCEQNINSLQQISDCIINISRPTEQDNLKKQEILKDNAVDTVTSSDSKQKDEESVQRTNMINVYIDEKVLKEGEIVSDIPIDIEVTDNIQEDNLQNNNCILNIIVEQKDCGNIGNMEDIPGKKVAAKKTQNKVVLDNVVEIKPVVLDYSDIDYCDIDMDDIEPIDISGSISKFPCDKWQDTENIYDSLVIQRLSSEIPEKSTENNNYISQQALNYNVTNSERAKQDEVIEDLPNAEIYESAEIQNQMSHSKRLKHAKSTGSSTMLDKHKFYCHLQSLSKGFDENDSIGHVVNSKNKCICSAKCTYDSKQERSVQKTLHHKHMYKSKKSVCEMKQQGIDRKSNGKHISKSNKSVGDSRHGSTKKISHKHNCRSKKTVCNSTQESIVQKRTFKQIDKNDDNVCDSKQEGFVQNTVHKLADRNNKCKSNANPEQWIYLAKKCIKVPNKKSIFHTGFEVCHVKILINLDHIPTFAHMQPKKLYAGGSHDKHIGKCLLCKSCSMYFTPIEFTLHHDSSNVVSSIDAEKSRDSNYSLKEDGDDYTKKIFSDFLKFFNEQKNKKNDGLPMRLPQCSDPEIAADFYENCNATVKHKKKYKKPPKVVAETVHSSSHCKQQESKSKAKHKTLDQRGPSVCVTVTSEDGPLLQSANANNDGGDGVLPHKLQKQYTHDFQDWDGENETVCNVDPASRALMAITPEYTEPFIAVTQEFTKALIDVRQEFTEPHIDVKQEFTDPLVDVRQEFTEPLITVTQACTEPLIDVRQEFRETHIAVKQEFTEPLIPLKQECTTKTRNPMLQHINKHKQQEFNKQKQIQESQKLLQDQPSIIAQFQLQTQKPLDQIPMHKEICLSPDHRLFELGMGSPPSQQYNQPSRHQRFNLPEYRQTSAQQFNMQHSQQGFNIPINSEMQDYFRYSSIFNFRDTNLEVNHEHTHTSVNLLSSSIKHEQIMNTSCDQQSNMPTNQQRHCGFNRQSKLQCHSQERNVPNSQHCSPQGANLPQSLQCNRDVLPYVQQVVNVQHPIQQYSPQNFRNCHTHGQLDINQDQGWQAFGTIPCQQPFLLSDNQRHRILHTNWNGHTGINHLPQTYNSLTWKEFGSQQATKETITVDSDTYQVQDNSLNANQYRKAKSILLTSASTTSPCLEQFEAHIPILNPFPVLHQCVDKFGLHKEPDVSCGNHEHFSPIRLDGRYDSQSFQRPMNSHHCQKPTNSQSFQNSTSGQQHYAAVQHSETMPTCYTTPKVIQSPVQAMTNHNASESWIPAMSPQYCERNGPYSFQPIIQNKNTDINLSGCSIFHNRQNFAGSMLWKQYDQDPSLTTSLANLAHIVDSQMSVTHTTDSHRGIANNMHSQITQEHDPAVIDLKIRELCHSLGINTLDKNLDMMLLSKHIQLRMIETTRKDSVLEIRKDKIQKDAQLMCRLLDELTNVKI